jgi:hypothetical protein
MSFCARCGLSQSAGFSAIAFSSPRRAFALSQSKMPPQQRKRLFDLVDHGEGFRAHGRFPNIWTIVMNDLVAESPAEQTGNSRK